MKTYGPYVANMFYSGDKNQLQEQVNTYLNNAKKVEFEGKPFGLLCPHAGYEFCGSIIGASYKAVDQMNFDTVIILAVPHRFRLRGAACIKDGIFRIPTGEICVDTQTTEELIKNSNCLLNNVPLSFEGEHSMEVQLPFIKTVLPIARIVPILVGSMNKQDCKSFGKALCLTVRNKKCLIVVSSDMYHGEDYRRCEKIDTNTISILKKLDPDVFYDSMAKDTVQMCGGFGMSCLIYAAQHCGNITAKPIDYINSSSVRGSSRIGEYCVGYSSVIFFEKDSTILNQDQKKRLLKIARESIENYLKTGEIKKAEEKDPSLLQSCGAFVSLHKKNGELRGCIGNIIASEPLYQTVQNMAIASATEDSRFLPLTMKELPDVDIEISVLSVPEKIADISQIELGRHGVIVKRGLKSGVFLPQVADQTCWTKEEFLSNLCQHKACIARDAWKLKDTNIYIFTAEVFREGG